MIKVGGEKRRGKLRGTVIKLYERFYLVQWDVGYRECIPMPRVATPLEPETKGTRWENGLFKPHEVEVIMNQNLSAKEVAKIIGRTPKSVLNKRAKLRRAAVA